jgi:hypothetical protein
MQFYVAFFLFRFNISTPHVYAQSRPAPWLASWFIDTFLYSIPCSWAPVLTPSARRRLSGPEALFWGSVLLTSPTRVGCSCEHLSRSAQSGSYQLSQSDVTPAPPPSSLPPPPPASQRQGCASTILCVRCWGQAGGWVGGWAGSQQCDFYLSPCEASGGGSWHRGSSRLTASVGAGDRELRPTRGVFKRTRCSNGARARVPWRIQ